MLPMWVTAAFAAVLVGFMLHLNSQMASLRAQVQQIGAHLGAQVQQIGAEALQMEARIGVQAQQMEARIGAQAQQMEARMVARFDGLDARFDRLTASVDGLLVSTLTPAAAQATLACGAGLRLHPVSVY